MISSLFNFARTISESLVPEINIYSYLVKCDFRIAIVGFGKMGLLHSGILNLLKNGSVKAVVDKSMLIRFGGSLLIKSFKFYKNIDKMIDEIKPNAVYVTTPVMSHYPILKELLLRKIKYIFVEKPPTINHIQLADLIRLMEDDQHIMVGLQKRYALPFRHAKRLLDSSIIGDIKSIYGYIRSSDVLSYTRRFDKIGRGVLLDLGIHLLDIITWMFEIDEIIDMEQRKIYTNVDDYFSAKLRTNEGAIVTLEATWSDNRYRIPETYIEIHGNEGVLKVTEDYLYVKAKKGHKLLNYNTELRLYKPHYYQGIPPVNLADPEYTIENLHFLQTICMDKQPDTNIYNLMKTMKLLDDLYTFMRNG